MDHLFHNRLNFKYVPSNKTTIRLELRNRWFYGDEVTNSANFSHTISKDNGIVDMSWNILNEGKLLFNTTIDRALIDYSSGDWEVTIGRQRVNWGMNLIWNPNDIFNTYNFLDFDYEERPGSDAVRVQYYLGDSRKIEFAAKKGKGNNDHMVAVMYKFNKWLYDIQLLSGINQEDWIIGVGWAGNLDNAGFKGELSYFVPHETYFNSKNVLSASISVDYGFKKGLYINGSVLYNSSGNLSITDLGSLGYGNLSAKNLMPYEFSSFLQLAKEFTPIVRGTLSTVYSPYNDAVILMPSVNCSIDSNWEFDLISHSFLNSKSLGLLEIVCF